MQELGKLKIWQKAMDFTEAIYEHTALFPNEEKFALTSQIRRATVSIPSNIAEGAGRNHPKELLDQLSEVQRMNYALQNKLVLEKPNLQPTKN